MRLTKVTLIAALLVSLGVTRHNQSDPEAEYRKAAADFASACSRGEASPLIAGYADDAVQIDATTPERHIGKAAIAAALKAFLSGSRMTCSITVKSFRLLAPTVGVGEGTATYSAPGMKTINETWMNTRVHRGGRWLTVYEMNVVK